MNLPGMHVSLSNRTKLEILDVLQGISRYISGIHIEKPLVDYEGDDIFLFLKKRYPTKDIILSLANETEVTPELLQLVRHNFIRIVAISTKLKDLQKFVDSLRSQKKKIILIGTEFDESFLIKNNIKNLFFFQPQKTGKVLIWENKIINQIKKYSTGNYNVLVGSINAHNVMQFQKLVIQTFVVREELCSSFNSIGTCKDIFQQVKNYFLDEDA